MRGPPLRDQIRRLPGAVRPAGRHPGTAARPPRSAAPRPPLRGSRAVRLEFRVSDGGYFTSALRRASIFFFFKRDVAKTQTQSPVMAVSRNANPLAVTRLRVCVCTLWSLPRASGVPRVFSRRGLDSR